MYGQPPDRESGITLPRNYQRLALIYLAVSAVVFCVTLYFVWSRATIVVTTSAKEINQTVTLQIQEGVAAKLDNDVILVPGKVAQFELEKTVSVPTTGKKAVDPNAIGEVTLINESSKDQTLVEKTRLSDPEKPDVVLVRFKKTVTVPAGGKITAAVYPDNPETFTTLKPMRFVIPGLAQSLQKTIYARNENDLVAGGATVAAVTEDDRKNAAQKVRQEVAQAGLEQFNSQLSQEELIWPKLVSLGEGTVVYSAEVGQPSAELQATLKIKVVAAAFDEGQFVGLLRQKFRDELPGQPQVSLDAKTFTYNLSEYDLEAKFAKVKTKVVGSARSAGTDLDIQAKDLTGLTMAQVKEKLGKLPGVASVEVQFHPSWLNKTPRFAGKIDIQYKSE